MFTRTPSPVQSISGGDPSIADLIDQAGDLKGELVAFVESPRFAHTLDALLCEAADDDGRLDAGRAVLAIDHFALQHRLADGRTVVERFVAQRRPRLSEDERAMVLGRRDVVEGFFEVGRDHGESVELHNLLDDVVYSVHSTMGRGALRQLRRGMFVVCRIVPVHPATDAWLVSGNIAAYPRSAGRVRLPTRIRSWSECANGWATRTSGSGGSRSTGRRCSPAGVVPVSRRLVGSSACSSSYSCGFDTGIRDRESGREGTAAPAPRCPHRRKRDQSVQSRHEPTRMRS